MNHPQHIVAVGSLIKNKDNQILLVKTEARGWELPGGQVEVGEDIISALKREVLEEADVKIESLRLSAFYSSISQPSKVIIDFIAHGVGSLKYSNEIIDASWLTPQDALLNIKNDVMAYRLDWLLKQKRNVRYAYFSKKPFKVVSETIF